MTIQENKFRPISNWEAAEAAIQEFRVGKVMAKHIGQPGVTGVSGWLTGTGIELEIRKEDGSKNIIMERLNPLPIF